VADGAAPRIEFDEPSHTYKVNGLQVPSVTQVLQLLDSFAGVPFDVLEAAREFGQHVHKTVELDVLGELDEESLDPALAEYLAGWRKFLDESGAGVIAVETIVASEELRFAGKLDLVLDFAGGTRGRRLAGGPMIADIKSGQIPLLTVGPQTAAYEHCYRKSRPLISRPMARACIQLMPNDYRFVPLRDPRDWNVFLSALNIHHWRNS
jgi:hypothetical protein